MNSIQLNSVQFSSIQLVDWFLKGFGLRLKSKGEEGLFGPRMGINQDPPPTTSLGSPTPPPPTKLPSVPLASADKGLQHMTGS